MRSDLPRALWIGGAPTLLALAALACNATSRQPNTQATVQAVYATITAQAAASPLPTQPPISTPLPTSTLALSPTAPETRTGNGANLTIGRCQNAVTPDANDADWISQGNVAGAALDTVTYGAAEWTGPNDLSGYVRLCWNDSGLYLFVDVTDDIHVQDQRGETSWKGDEVEFMFDADLRTDFYDTVWNNDDIQLGFNPGNFGDLAPAPYEYHPTAGSPHGVEMAAAPTGTNSNYRLEAGILWDTVLSTKPAAGESFGMCVALSDNDHLGEARQDSMVSHCTRLKVTDPTTWITATLGG